MIYLCVVWDFLFFEVDILLQSTISLNQNFDLQNTINELTVKKLVNVTSQESV